MSRYEIDKVARYQAGLEAVQLLDEAGFSISDFELSAEGIRDVPISLNLDLAITEDESPLQILEDDPDEEFGAGFSLGFLLGLMTDCDATPG